MTAALTPPATQPAECPNAALRFSVSELQFAAPKTNEKPDTKSRAVNILARTKEPLYHWYWGWCVHDFEGMSAKPRFVFDWCHDDNEIIGVGETATVTDAGLELGGRIESIVENDEAEKLLKRADKNIPFEASIYFAPDLLEFVPEGSKVEVNGKPLTGPMTIFREWRLRACSVCPHGYDAGAETQFSIADVSPVKLNWKGNPMSKTTTTQLSAEQTDARAQVQADLAKFTAKFGATDGVTYFSQNLSFADAMERHLDKLTADHAAAITKLTADHTAAITKLTADLETANAAKAEAETRLSAAKGLLGENKPLETGGKTEGDNKKSFSSMIRPKA